MVTESGSARAGGPARERGSAKAGGGARERGAAKERRLAKEDWAAAALAAIGQGGLAAVAVEPLAAGLGATKGSFYWHFPNRDALVTAALAVWEEHHTEATIVALAAEPDPVARLRTLLTGVLTSTRGRTELNLLAASDHPLVGPVIRRVTARRLAYLVDLLIEIGFPRVEAEWRGLLGYTIYAGNQELAVRLPELLPDPTGPALRRHIDRIMELLLTPLAPHLGAPTAPAPPTESSAHRADRVADT